MKYHFEKVISDSGQSFKTEEVIGPVVDCVFHVHPEFELTYVESSFGVRFIGDNIAEFSEDDLVMTGKMLPHHYLNSPHDSKGLEWSRLKVIKFSDDFAGDKLFGLAEFSDIRMMLDDATNGLVFNKGTARKVKPLIDRIFASENAMRVILFLELLSELAVSEYSQLSANLVKPKAMTMDERLRRVLDFIHSRLENNNSVSLNDTAKIACMTPQAFSHYFHHSTRKKFIDYINELKISRACGLLASTNVTIIEVSFRAGFNNLSNFNRHFNRLKGLSPREFRKKYRM